MIADVDDLFDSPWGRCFVLRISDAGIVYENLETGGHVVGGLDELPFGRTPLGLKHVRQQRLASEPSPVALAVPLIGIGTVDEWLAELPPLPDLEDLTLGASRPGSIRETTPDALTWTACQTPAVVEENGVKYLGSHCWFITPADSPEMWCPGCAAIVVTREPRVAPRPYVRPTGPVAIIGGKPVTLDELAADAARRIAHRVAPTPVACPEQPAPACVAPGYIPATADAWREELGERAAIYEYLGGLSRTEAERTALATVPRFAATAGRERRYDGQIDPTATRVSRWAGERAEPDDPRSEVGAYTATRAAAPRAPAAAERVPSGPSRCRSCDAPILWAATIKDGNVGSTAPWQVDDRGEWTITRAVIVGRPGSHPVAQHVGPAPMQLELGAPRAPAAERYTSHFARCPDAARWRAQQTTKEKR